LEAITDRLAARPWEELGQAATARFDEAMAPLAAAVADQGVLRYPNPIGLPPTA
jgi:hypothetical protein